LQESKAIFTAETRRRGEIAKSARIAKIAEIDPR